MNTLGSPPGATLFRLSIMIILIAILMVAFFRYLDDAEKELERTSILQTRKIIDSALTVVFATYAVNNRLIELNDLDGGNPFVFLEEYRMLPAAYIGEIDHDMSTNLTPGWYYLSHRGMVGYKSYFTGLDGYFKIALSYQDLNQTGYFEPAEDKFQNLQFVKIVDF